MNKNNNSELLPEGFKVLLPNHAEKEEFASRKILDMLNKNGYLLVKTPLLEYENTKISSSSNQKLQNTNHEPFILMEPSTKKILVICDEHHHAAIDASWGKNAELSFANSKYTLILTGTPIRSDGKNSVWIETGNSGISFPKDGIYTLTYGEAINLGYCRPATFHRHEGKYKVKLADGKEALVSSKSKTSNIS